jgi:hypothetical protein
MIKGEKKIINIPYSGYNVCPVGSQAEKMRLCMGTFEVKETIVYTVHYIIDNRAFITEANKAVKEEKKEETI